MRKFALAVVFFLAAFPPAFGAAAPKKKASTPEKKTQKADSKPQKEKKTAAKPAITAKSLYDRLGGKDILTGVADQFVANAAGDNRLSKFFVKMDLPSFKAKLVDQMCQVSGGPCKYEGKPMKETHQGMGISDVQFNAWMDNLSRALDQTRVAKAEKDELLSTLSRLRGEIVEKKEAAK